MKLHDPYAESKPPPAVDASVLDLLQTDRFFDQSKGYDDPDAAIIGHLSSIDDEIDACRRSSNLKGMSASTAEGQALAALCSVDRLVDTRRADQRVAEGDLFDSYYSKSHSPRTKNNIVPHLHAPAVYQFGGDTPAMMDLLSTDELVDGKRQEREAVTDKAHALHMDLLSVDAAMDQARYQVERPATVLDALHNMDNEVDRMAAVAGSTARTASITACESTVSSSEKGSALPPSAIEAELAAAGLTGILADLYSMDRRVDGVADAFRTKDEVAAILELYNIDVTVGRGRTKKSSSSGANNSDDLDSCDKILLDLFKVDALVDTGGKGGSALESADGSERLFVDPHEAAAMRQVQLYAARDLHDEARIGAIMDLLRTDLDIDGKRHHDIGMEGVQALLDVDRSIDGNKAASCRQHDISDILPLCVVDRAVDRHKSKGSSLGKQSSVPTDPMEYMLYVDRLVDGTTFRKSQDKINEMIGDLRKVDESVDKIFMPDIFAGFGGSNSHDDVSNLPPPPVFEDEPNADTAIKENTDNTSYEHQTRDAIGHLLEVDQEVGVGHKVHVERQDPEVLVMLDLFRVDIEVDKAKLAALKSIGFGGSNASAPPSPIATPQENEGENESKRTRSIFSTKEKRHSMEHAAGTNKILGTTTRVNPRKKIGSIPLGEIVTSQLHHEFFGEAEMAPIDPYAPRTGSQSKEKDEQCSIM